MTTNTKSFLLVIAAVLIIAGGLIFAATRTDKDNTKEAENDTVAVNIDGTVAGVSTNQAENPDVAYTEKLAKFMTTEGMVMYGAYWCSHCQDQKKIFGDAFQYVDYVECDAQGPNANPDECSAQGIEGYPTWIYKGTKYSGVQSLSKIANIVGFTQ